MKILIVSPCFIPDANVGKQRMASLVRSLATKHEVTVMQDAVSSYKSVTNEPSISEVQIVEVNVKDSFINNVFEYCRTMKLHLKTHNYDAILISIGPFYTLPLVGTIKHNSKIPVILDYRDLWTNTFRKNENKNLIKRLIKVLLFEKPALKKVDAITVCAEGEISVLLKQYPFLELIPNKCIFNGYDDAQLEGIDVSKKHNNSNELTIGIYGKFEVYIGEENLEWFTNEISNFSSVIGKKIRIIHFGGEELLLRESFEKTNIIYDWRGFVEYKCGMRILAQESDIFMAANDVMIGYGTKIFDYIFLNRPIIMYALNGSDLYRKVNTFENGCTFEDKESLKSGLNKIMKYDYTYLDNNIIATEYSRSRQNRIFEKFICEIIEKR